jgi:ABC-type nitrate/sulfonate/bicarbonate transport system substrate-binding protein
MTGKNVKIIGIIVVLVAILGIISATGLFSGNPAIKDEKKPDIIRLPNTLVDGAFIADEKGFFEEQNIKIEWTGKQAHGPAAIVSIVAGQNDAGSSISTAMINAIAQGSKLKIVLGQSKSTAELPLFRYMVPENSSITGKPQDFIGKKVVASPTTITWYPLVLYLKRNGVDYNKVEYITLPSPLAIEQAIKQGQVDVIGASESSPPGSKLIAEGGYRFLPGITDFEVLGIPQIGGWAMREDFIEKNPDLTKRFIAALVKAYNWGNSNPVEAQEILNRRNEYPAQFWEFQKYRPVPENGLVDGGSIKKWIDIMVEFGQLKEGQVKPEDVYTNEFNPYFKK